VIRAAPPANVFLDLAIVLTVGEFPKCDCSGLQMEELADLFGQLRIGSTTENL